MEARPPVARSDTSTGRAQRATRSATSAPIAIGVRLPPRSETHRATAPGSCASARASSAQRESPDAGSGPRMSVGTKDAPASRAPSAMPSIASGSFRASYTRTRLAPLATADDTRRRATPDPSGTSPSRVRPASTMPTGAPPAWRDTTRRRSSGLSVRPSMHARAAAGSMASRARAPTGASAAAAEPRSSGAMRDPHGGAPRSRRVTSTKPMPLCASVLMRGSRTPGCGCPP